MTWRVLSVAYPFAPVGPDAVGGAEQVLTFLDAELTRAGHESLVVACSGSQASGTLLEVDGLREHTNGANRREVYRRYREAIDCAVRGHQVDLVHLHGLDFHEYLPTMDVPVLVTLHVPFTWYKTDLLAIQRPRTYYHCVSTSQRATFPSALPMLPDLPNGVPVEQLFTRVTKRDYAMALGRIAPEKGFHLAIDAAKRARMPLLVAGELFAYAEHERYYDQEFAPRLDCMRQYIGPIGFARKRRLLGGAQCLVVTSQVPETSSLVAMEALACGTPVVALRVGALPEIVEHGRTGFVVDTVDEMAAAMRQARQLNSAVCRAAACERFSLRAAARRYFATYESILAGHV